MKTILISMLMLGVVQAGENPADPTVRAAVAAFYVASDDAQRAVDEVMCGTMRRWRHLDGETMRQVRHIKVAVEAAREAGGLEALVEFCDWAGER